MFERQSNIPCMHMHVHMRMHIHDGCGIGMRLRLRLRTAPHDGCGSVQKMVQIRPHAALHALKIFSEKIIRTCEEPVKNLKIP